MTCDLAATNGDAGDYSCFYGEGTFIKQEITKCLMRTKDDKAHSETNSISDYQVSTVTFAIGCSCQILKDSVFSNFTK